jgi:predicted amidophosphoribosyltransferase
MTSGLEVPAREALVSHSLHTLDSVEFANALLDLAGAERCCGCGRRGDVLCRACAGSLRPAPPVRSIAGVDRALAAVDYVDPARALVLALKLGGRRRAAAPLAAAMWSLVVREGLWGGVVTWVPARAADVRMRGFDHAELLARAVACRTGLPARRLLIRTGPAPDQASLGAAERRHNLAGAFGARPCPPGVVLVDDLVTTGATAAACAAALRAAGAETVELLAACRTP